MVSTNTESSKFLTFSFQFFGNISESFEFQKFWSHNMKVMAKDRKVNIAATNNLVFCHWQAFSAKTDIK